jgi:hypothetical protein
MVKSKRNRLDSLKRERLRKQQIRVIAENPVEKNQRDRRSAKINNHFNAIKPSDEEQFI